MVIDVDRIPRDGLAVSRDFEFLSLDEEREGTRGFWHALLRRRRGPARTEVLSAMALRRPP